VCRSPPNIYFKKKKTGGVSINSTMPLTRMDDKLIQRVLQEYKIHNCEVGRGACSAALQQACMCHDYTCQLLVFARLARCAISDLARGLSCKSKSKSYVLPVQHGASARKHAAWVVVPDCTGCCCLPPQLLFKEDCSANSPIDVNAAPLLLLLLICVAAPLSHSAAAAAV